MSGASPSEDNKSHLKKRQIMIIKLFCFNILVVDVRRKKSCALKTQ